MDFSKLMADKDKANHFMWANIVFTATYLASTDVGIASGVTVTVILAKEAYDKWSKKGTPSWADIGFGLAGMLTSLAVLVAPKFYT